MHIPPKEQNARVVLGHDLDRDKGDDTATRPRARAMAAPTGVSARAAEPNEPDRRSIAIEPDSRLTYSPHFPSGLVPDQELVNSAVEPRPRFEHLAGGESTSGR